MVEWTPPDLNLIEKWQGVLEQNVQDKNTYNYEKKYAILYLKKQIE